MISPRFPTSIAVAISASVMSLIVRPHHLSLGDLQRPASSVQRRVSSVEPFRDCRECPSMVVVPAGTFIMGSSAEEKTWAVQHGAKAGSVADEAPQHPVVLPAFALGRFDVTLDEYATFVRETGRTTAPGCGHDAYNWDLDSTLSWQNPGFNQNGHDPVVCVSWNDARAYVMWLNGKIPTPNRRSGEDPYRLPSEAEWEYAARGGTRTLFWWGDSVSDAPAHAWFKDNSGGHSHPVGSRPANPFGLFDMVGDVWQWTADCYSESYANVPADGGAAADSSGCMRVDRGGSWLMPAWMLRAATRERNIPDFRDRFMGFRVAKTLPSAAAK